MQSSQLARSAQEAIREGRPSGQKTINTCSPGGAHASKNGKRPGRLHVAIHSVHAVKPSLQETHKKPARAFMQPKKPIHASRNGKRTGRIRVAMQSVRAVSPSLQLLKAAWAPMQGIQTCSPGGTQEHKVNWPPPCSNAGRRRRWANFTRRAHEASLGIHALVLAWRLRRSIEAPVKPTWAFMRPSVAKQDTHAVKRNLHK